MIAINHIVSIHSRSNFINNCNLFKPFRCQNNINLIMGIFKPFGECHVDICDFFCVCSVFEIMILCFVANSKILFIKLSDL